MSSSAHTESAEADSELMTERVQLVISPSLVRKVDAWRGRQEDVPNRSKAIRLLIEHSLAGNHRPRRQA
jgi:metal-responsive CopG/Arc/MetJ family transcriptional regulator